MCLRASGRGVREQQTEDEKEDLTHSGSLDSRSPVARVVPTLASQTDRRPIFVADRAARSQIEIKNSVREK